MNSTDDKSFGEINSSKLSSEKTEEVTNPTVELCKMITGLDYENESEKVLHTMMQERVKISERYGLPLIEKYSDKQELCNKLVDIAMLNGVEVKFVERVALKELDMRGGYTNKGKVILTNIDFKNSSSIDLYNWAVEFEHELTHALQAVKSPEVPIEEQEYEAYLLSYLPTACSLYKDYPSGDIQYYMIVNEMFEHIKNSSLAYYKKVGKNSDEVEWISQKSSKS